VGIPEIREELALWGQEHSLAAWSLEDQLRLALALFESSLAEDKLAGILYLQGHLYDRLSWKALLREYEGLFSKGLIFDWNTCDWFGVRVLGPTIALHGLPPARAIAAWQRAEDLWQARASVVAFVPVAGDPRFHPLVYDACRVLILREERFAKTAVGWVLREISGYDKEGVRAFVEAHLREFSIESLRNALKSFTKEDRDRYVRQLKAG
jgi:3-methyladenine DNA glycosylase AlkD